MKVRATTQIVGLDFTFALGQEVDSSVFEAKVGVGWRALCEPTSNDVERAVKPTAPERRSGRR